MVRFLDNIDGIEEILECIFSKNITRPKIYEITISPQKT